MKIHYWVYGEDVVADHEFDIEDQIFSLSHLDPEKTAENDFKTGQIHFYGIMGVGLGTPGAGLDEHPELHSVKVRVISGTSDYLERGIQEELSEVAASFSRNYNRRMLSLILEDDS